MPLSNASPSSTSPTLWIKHPLACADPAAAGGIVVRDRIIVEKVAAAGQPQTLIDQVYDASDSVLLPGLINTHHHFYQTLTRALSRALNKPLFPWLQSLYPVWAQLDAHSLRIATRLALTELLLSGCTTAADHHYVFPRGLEDSLDIQVEEAQRLGIRMALTRGSMSLGQDQGGLPPRQVIQREDQIMADCERVVQRFHQRQPGAMTTVALAPCSPFSVTKDLMRASAEMAAREDLRLHTHLAETEDENQYCLRQFRQRPLDYLESCGWLSSRVWLAHGIHFNAAEIQRLGEHQVGIAHCPSSNMLLASGICPTLELQAAGAHIGLAVDGSASNDCSNMMQELRQALLIGRLKYGAKDITAQQVLAWATMGSARCLGRRDIGTLEPGQQADVALFKLDELRFSGAQSPLDALILCGAQRADRVMIAGQWRVVDGAPLGLDIAALQAEHSAAAQALWRRADAALSADPVQPSH